MASVSSLENSNTLAGPAPGQAAPRGGRPRLGFLGVGWIGRNRLEAIVRSGLTEIVVIADPSDEMVREAAKAVPEAEVATSLEDLLRQGVDGVVIASPSALHAEQSLQCLEAGAAVFCQKPLGRNGRETAAVIELARRQDLLLGVDLSYRHITAMREVHRVCREGALGEVYAADVVFHNAYGPDKPWFYDRAQSGGGCLIDLGIHLIDQALWNLRFPQVTRASSRIFAQGRPLTGADGAVEDYCEGRLDLATGATVRVSCSWKLPAGRDAVIQGTFYGTKGGAAFSNVEGSFYDFIAERFEGTRRHVLHAEPEQWGGLAAVEWARRLASGKSFDPEILTLNPVANALDEIYAAAGGGR